jgi:cytochrome c551/c552
MKGAMMMRRSLATAAAALFVLSGCGGDEKMAEPGATGDPQRGKEVFSAQGCGSCHTYAPAGTTAKVGPSLDVLPTRADEEGKSLADFARESIVEPNAVLPAGFMAGVMPSDFGQKLSDQELNDLVAFLSDGS